MIEATLEARCDEQECKHRLSVMMRSGESALVVLRMSGWTFQFGMYGETAYCPSCSLKRKEGK